MFLSFSDTMSSPLADAADYSGDYLDTEPVEEFETDGREDNRNAPNYL